MTVRVRFSVEGIPAGLAAATASSIVQTLTARGFTAQFDDTRQLFVAEFDSALQSFEQIRLIVGGVGRQRGITCLVNLMSP